MVASEVGTLAKRSSDAAKNIKDLILTSSEQVAEGNELVASTDTALAEILESVESAAGMIKQIADANREQSTGVEEISMAVGEMDEMTQQNAQLAERSSSDAQALTLKADNLIDLVGVFVTGDMDMANDRASGGAPARVDETFSPDPESVDLPQQRVGKLRKPA